MKCESCENYKPVKPNRHVDHGFVNYPYYVVDDGYSWWDILHKDDPKAIIGSIRKSDKEEVKV